MKRLIYWLWGVLFPRKCMLCSRFLTEDETDLCHSCRTDAPEYPFGALNPDPNRKNTSHFLDSFTAVWYYEDNVRRSILRYKFHRRLFLAPKFGRIMAMKLMTQGLDQPDMLTWVPVSTLRRLRRGYDQCEILAKAIGQELGLEPVRLLRKVRHTPPQSGMTSASARKANVLGAFGVVPNADLAGKRVLLIDDVITTGATMNECARVLLTAGAKEVHSAAIAAARFQNKPSR